MIYRGIFISYPNEGSSPYINRLIFETPWAEFREIFPDIYKEASQLVSIYHMAQSVLSCGVIQYYQAVFSNDEPDPNPNKLMPCEEWQCIAFDQLCRFSRCNYAQTAEHKQLTTTLKAFRAMEGDPEKGYVAGADTFERLLNGCNKYFFQVCEQKAEYLCKYMGKELSKRITSKEKQLTLSKKTERRKRAETKKSG